MNEIKIELLGITNKEQIEEQIKIVAAAGKLSRYPGNVTGVYESCNDFEKNVKFIKGVIGMGHESILDHDFLVFAMEDVSIIVEQILIQERFSAFTVKSRREVDFENSGYVIPTFKDNDGNLLENQKELTRMYVEHMDFLFKTYGVLKNSGISYEDARFVLPYCYHSNFIMGIDAHVVKDLIIRFTKGKESKIDELREVGEKMLEIVKERAPYLVDVIENAKIEQGIREKLDEIVDDKEYQIIDKVKLTNRTSDIDKQIFISALMQTYQFSYEKACNLYEEKIANNPVYKKELMKVIVNDFQQLPLTQVSFNFQIPVSLAVLTHITRHRTHDIMVPDFVPVHDLLQYKIPPKIAKVDPYLYDNIYEENASIYEKFKELGVRDEDLIYFHLSGNMVNIITNMDAKTVAWILRLRLCNKAQWEISNITRQMKELILNTSEIYPEILGPDCEVKGKCIEGKESCGKIKVLKK